MFVVNYYSITIIFHLVLPEVVLPLSSEHRDKHISINTADSTQNINSKIKN